jgi:hypothetical protein
LIPKEYFFGQQMAITYNAQPVWLVFLVFYFIVLLWVLINYLELTSFELEVLRMNKLICPFILSRDKNIINIPCSSGQST